MRPTFLQFRSPKEKTPAPYKPEVTITGQRIDLKSIRKTSSFARSKRFIDYELDAQRTGPKVGPAAYDLQNFSVGNKWIKGSPIVKPLYRKVSKGNNGFFYVGNQVVYDPDLEYFTKKNSMNRSTKSAVSLIRQQTSDRNITPIKSRPSFRMNRPVSAQKIPKNY